MKLSKDEGPGRVLHAWWREVAQERDKGSARAARAILRRANDITAVTLTQPYQQLFRRLRDAGWDDRFAVSNDALAAVVGLLVHIETEAAQTSLAEAMSQCPAGSTKPYVSEARFRRLLEAPDIDALFVGLRRALPLMSAGAPVLVLAEDLLSWARPERRDEVKKRWAYRYAWPQATAH
ncbi:MAG: type I-E CRISPR-associated protein Cse2/CasB [Burkholderiaceae bacterium]|nr:type I-E CRISPR-associated protein Cse2/CasB [Burkholderiaceae bacterium]